MMSRILVTGAQGFVGRALVANAVSHGMRVRASARRSGAVLDARVEHYHEGDVETVDGWAAALDGVDVVVHCAGRAHILNDTAPDPLAAFRLVNVDGTLNLARLAVAAGVKRFVFISSIGVNGMATAPGTPFSETDRPNPATAYGMSKWEAEQGLLRFAEGSGMDVVIIRPPLVYGSGAPGNFGALMRAVQCGWPLPLGAVHNRRSFVALDNLVDFVLACTSHPQAANEIFLVSDGQDLSTTELLYAMASAAAVPARLVPAPVWVLRAGARLLGRGDAIDRLCGNLQVDISKARSLLGWTPTVSVAAGLRGVVSGVEIA